MTGTYQTMHNDLDYVRLLEGIPDDRLPKFTGKVESRLYESSLKGERTDVVFQFDALSSTSCTLHAHSAVLMNESEAFKVMLDERWKKEGKEGVAVIPLPGDDMEDFRKFLKLLYGLRSYIPDDYQLVIPAFNLADKYEATDVLEYCNEYFRKTYIDVYNSGRVTGKAMVLAKTYMNQTVFDAIMGKISRDPWTFISCDCTDPSSCKDCSVSGWIDWDEAIFTKILESDTMKSAPACSSSKNESELLEFALRWLKHRSKSIAFENDDGGAAEKRSRIVDEAQAVRIIQKIRFKSMNYEDLQESLKSLVGILSDAQIGQISLMYSGGSAAAAELISAYGQENLFIMNMNERTWKHSSG